MPATEIIPFGKYRGQPLEVLQADQAYCDWLLGQDWLGARFPALRTLIINQFAEPSETPEHNVLQARFLDPRFRRAVAQAVRARHPSLNDEWSAWRDERLAFEQDGADVLLGDCLAVEVKPTMGDDYPAVMRQMKANGKNRWKWWDVIILGAYTGTAVPLDQVRSIFETSGMTFLLVDEIEALMEQDHVGLSPAELLARVRASGAGLKRDARGVVWIGGPAALRARWIPILRQHKDALLKYIAEHPHWWGQGGAEGHHG